MPPFFFTTRQGNHPVLATNSVPDSFPRNLGIRLLALAACLSFGAIVCSAADRGALLEEAVDSMTLTQLNEFMAGEGYAVEVKEAGFLQWKLEGFNCQIFVSEDAESLQFHSSFADGTATLKRVNEWNRTKRYSRSYLDDDGDPHLELDLDMCGGVTTDRIRDFFKTCRVSFEAWKLEVVK